MNDRPTQAPALPANGESLGNFRPGLRPAATDSTLPLYSLVTIVRNAAGTIGRTVASVAAQDYPNLEYIVVDAASTDGTIEILKAQEAVISLWCSEKDRGFADGSNKGIAAAHGAYIGFVFADDWLPPDFVSKSVAALERSGAGFVFGDLDFNGDSGFLFRRPGDPDYARKLTYRMPAINFPTLSARREAYAKAGLYDERFQVAPDYEWVLRAHLAGFMGHYDPAIRYNFSLGGNSDARIAAGLREVARAARMHGVGGLRAPLFCLLGLSYHRLEQLMRAVLPPRLHGALRQFRAALLRRAGV